MEAVLFLLDFVAKRGDAMESRKALDLKAALESTGKQSEESNQGGGGADEK